MRYYIPEILLETREVIVVEKPAGLLTISAGDERDNTLYKEVGNYLKGRYGPSAKVFIVHRLDKDTSGVIVFAKDYRTKERLQELFAEGKIIRNYQAILSSSPKEKEGTIINYLKEDSFHNAFLSSPQDREAEKAITEYKITGSVNNHPEAEIRILTGKRNQIRIGFMSLGCPLLGDKKYGGEKAKRLCLCACSLDLRAFCDQSRFFVKSPKCLF
ncbi:MAG: RNA pseudouridine synthase [Bacilli bacterium]|jgi:23S rRNA pseudouridine1911/1915/1917 synthase|nr:RNA pseudouridine synthase [Bacilli bacterium]